MTASTLTVAVAGSRRLPPAGVPLAQHVARALVTQGRTLAVGCCVGADAAVLAAAAAGVLPAPAVSVFAAFGPVSPPWRAVRYTAPGAWSGSAVAEVAGALHAGATVHWWAGGGPAVPLRVRLARRAREVVAAGPGGLVLVLGSPRSRGSLAAARVAADSGLPVVAFPVGFPADELPPLGRGHWRPAAAGGLWASAWRWHNIH